MLHSRGWLRLLILDPGKPDNIALTALWPDASTGIMGMVSDVNYDSIFIFLVDFTASKVYYFYWVFSMQELDSTVKDLRKYGKEI